MPENSTSSHFQNAICDLAQQLSPHTLARLCDLLESVNAPTDDSWRHRVLDVSTQPQTRQTLAIFLAQWRSSAPHLEPQSVVWALRCAQQMNERSAASSVELVWTGAQNLNFRRSDAALLQVIEAAQRELWIRNVSVSFRQLLFL